MISSINQLTSQQRASLIDDQLINIFSYMADHPNTMGSGLSHRGGRCQPIEEENTSSDHNGADEDVPGNLADQDA